VDSPQPGWGTDPSRGPIPAHRQTLSVGFGADDGATPFTIADQDAAIAYYTQKLGWELRADVPFGDEGANRRSRGRPASSTARLALNAPTGDWRPGGSAIGVETPDVGAEYERVQAIDTVKTGEMMGGDGPVPRMFSSRIPTATTSGSCSPPEPTPTPGRVTCTTTGPARRPPPAQRGAGRIPVAVGRHADEVKKLAVGAHGVLGVRPDRERDADAHDQTESRVAPIDENLEQVRSGRH